MDTTDQNIHFDEEGVCNHCKDYQKKIIGRLFQGSEGKKKIESFIRKIKKEGINKKYDCIIGLSGGVDSTYLAYLAKEEFGLKPLVVHLDNGWNSKIATKNINKVVKKLELDLFTYVINWEEFKDLQLAYLKASVLDIEALTDHAIKAALYKKANDEGIKYILSGVNLSTEGVIPFSWRYNKGDSKNIISIHKKYGKLPIETFPMLTILQRINYQFFKGIREIEVLNYVDYNKKKVKQKIIDELGWEDYGSKHGESVFTKFYQDYILPKKFGINKKRAHLSSLICSGQISREMALEEIENSIKDSGELKFEKEYVLRKLGLSREEFDKLMALPVKSHHDYPNNDKLFRNLRKIYLKILGN